MRPAEFEDEQIIEAGKRLLSEGRRVTGFALRKEIGGGNPSRLVRVWEEFRQSQEVVESQPVQDLPVEVEEALTEMTDSFLDQVRSLALNLNNRAVKTAERRVADVMKSAKEQQESQARALQDELDQTKRALNTANEENKTLGNRLVGLEKELAIADQKLSKEQEKTKDLKDEVAGLKNANKSLVGDKFDLREQRDGWKASAESREQEVSDVKNELSEAQGQVKELEAQKKASEALAEERKVDRESARAAQKDAETKVTQLETMLATSRSQNEELKADIKQLKKQLEELQKQGQETSTGREKGGKS